MLFSDWLPAQHQNMQDKTSNVENVIKSLSVANFN